MNKSDAFLFLSYLRELFLFMFQIFFKGDKKCLLQFQKVAADSLFCLLKKGN